MRFVGACGIVWFHVHAPGRGFTLAALPMFVALTVYYALRDAERASLRDVVVHRAQRLLVPWVAWSLIYAFAKLAEVLVTAKPLASEFQTYMLLTGPQIHLWFLPFAFIVVVAVRYLIARLGSPSGAPWLIAGYIALSATALLCFDATRPGPPLAQWLTAFPAVMLGLLLLRADCDTRCLWLAPIASIVIFLILVRFGAQNSAMPVLLASILVVGSFAFSFPAAPWTIRLSKLAFGIYLVHPLVVAVLERLPITVSGNTAKGLAVIAVSALVTMALRRALGIRRIV